MSHTADYKVSFYTIDQKDNTETLAATWVVDELAIEELQTVIRNGHTIWTVKDLDGISIVNLSAFCFICCEVE